MANNVSSGSGSLYFSDVGSANQYIQFTVRSTTANGFVCLRAESVDKYIGVRVSSSNLQVLENNSGYNTVYNVNHGIVSGDVVKVTLFGQSLAFLLNGSPIGGGDIGSSWSGTGVGVHARQAVQDPFIDNFEAGVLAEGEGPPLGGYGDDFNRANADLEIQLQRRAAGSGRTMA